jgi:hypothetical protein
MVRPRKVRAVSVKHDHAAKKLVITNNYRPTARASFENRAQFPTSLSPLKKGKKRGFVPQYKFFSASFSAITLHRTIGV